MLLESLSSEGVDYADTARCNIEKAVGHRIDDDTQPTRLYSSLRSLN